MTWDEHLAKTMLLTIVTFEQVPVTMTSLSALVELIRILVCLLKGRYLTSPGGPGLETAN